MPTELTLESLALGHIEFPIQPSLPAIRGFRFDLPGLAVTRATRQTLDRSFAMTIPVTLLVHLELGTASAR